MLWLYTWERFLECVSPNSKWVCHLSRCSQVSFCKSSSILCFISNVGEFYFSTVFPQSVLSSFWNFASLIGRKSNHSKVLIFVSFLRSQVEHLFKWLETCMFLFTWTAQFFCGINGTFLPSSFFSASLCIGYINHLSVIQVAIFPTLLFVFSVCLS